MTAFIVGTCIAALLALAVFFLFIVVVGVLLDIIRGGL